VKNASDISSKLQRESGGSQ